MQHQHTPLKMQPLGRLLADAWRLALPYFRSEERWPARGLLASVVALNLISVAVSVQLSFWNRAFYNSLQDKDWSSFLSLLLFYKQSESGFQAGFTVLAGLHILVAIYTIYLNQALRIRWRTWLTERLMGSWLAGQAYWHIALKVGGANAYGTDNPDQRISDDLNEFVTTTLSLSLGLLSSIVSLFSFVTILWGLSGPLAVMGISIPGYMVWVALAYALVATAATHYVGKPLAALDFRQERVEADFRFGLARMRENLEGIALYRGEATEQRAAMDRFSAVRANFHEIMSRTKKLISVTSGFGQAAVIFPIVIAAPRYFAGEIPLGAMTQTAGAFGRVETAMSFFVNAYSSIANWRAIVERLSSFQRAIDAARAAEGGVGLETSASPGYAMEGVSLSLPDGRVLLDAQSLRFTPGESVVISGRSGSGKSTLMRALAGIWPFGGGLVHRDPGSALFLPQRPYLPLGSLRRAVAYPADADAFDDATLQAALRDVGLGHLEDRLDGEEPWGQRLSGGEQQRLAVARALLVRPDWLFLDEATSSLDPEAEAELYALLVARLPGTTLVSIAHRPAVAAFHARHIVFGADAEGRMRLSEMAVVAAQ